MTAVGSLALATCSAFPAGDEDAGLVQDAFARAGVTASWQVWDDPAVDWSAFDVVLLRTVWDYTGRWRGFLEWATVLPRLVNPYPVVAWSSDKVYLRDLAAAGLPIVPTSFLAPGDDVEPAVTAALGNGSDVVVKPSVAAGSRGAGRFDAPTDAVDHVGRLHADGLVVLVQPYQAAVDTDGETAVVCFRGEFSHAARKEALLPPATVHALDATVTPDDHGLFVQEVIRPTDPSAAQTQVAHDVVAFLVDRFGAPPAYARIDLLPGPDGPRIVEVEVVEPSLFLGYAPRPADAADLFVAAVLHTA